MIVVDTSAWVEFLRRTGSAVDHRLDELIRSGADLAVTEVVVAEVLSGARSPTHLVELRSRLLSFPVLPLRGLAGYERAAELYRTCRASGETLRRLVDCLVAVPALERGASVLHRDAEFDVLARHTPLRIEPV